MTYIPTVVGSGGGGASTPGSLLLYHQFDGPSGSIDGVKPAVCFDSQTVFDTDGVSGVIQNGNGYAVDQSSGGRSIVIDPSNRWPSKTSKNRNYVVWGRFSAAPSSTNDYLPTVRINYVDPNNFWDCRLGHGSGFVYVQSYEWISGGVGENRLGANLSVGGAFRWQMHIVDQGDQVLTSVAIQIESTEASDLSISQPQSIQLHKSSRPNQDVAKLEIRWTGSREKQQIRGLTIFDSTD